MITRQRIVSYGIPAAAAATIVAAALLTTRKDKTIFEPVTKVPAYQTDGNAIDVVFAVDTTGSMGGLLDGAKRTVFSIATHIQKTDPNAQLRIGLVAYRDVGDAYITKPFALTSDVDAVYAELATYRAEGGNDTPENVDAALVDALRMDWREGARKLVFVVGDAPPASRGDVQTYDVSAREAAEQGITINTIRCGWDDQAAVAFQTIARLGNGEFSTIQQNGGVQQVETPYDQKLAALSSEYDGTTIVMGGEAARHRWEGKMAAAQAAPAAAKADRAGYYAKGAGGGMKRSDDDLVGGYATGTVDVAAVAPADLPDDMRDKPPAEIKAELDRRVEKRKQLQNEIQELTKQRDEYLSKQAKDGEGGFDAKVKETVEKQMKR